MEKINFRYNRTMFFSLVDIEVGGHLYWNIAGLVFHGEVLIILWLVIGIILSICFLGLVDLELLPKEEEQSFKEHAELLPKEEQSFKEHAELLPKEEQSFIEHVSFYVGFITKSQIGKTEHRRWIPLIGTLFIFIFVSNWIGALIPWKFLHLPASIFVAAPTSDINTPVALALLTSLSYFYAGINFKGLGFFTRYISPTIIFLPINILEDFSKPLSLSFRLFGNALADEIVIGVLCFLNIFLPFPVMFLGLFASSIQALVFSTLSGAYIAESMEE